MYFFCIKYRYAVFPTAYHWIYVEYNIVIDIWPTKHCANHGSIFIVACFAVKNFKPTIDCHKNVVLITCRPVQFSRLFYSFIFSYQIIKKHISKLQIVYLRTVINYYAYY